MGTVSDKQAKLVTKLKELFQMDQADLDFGLYRIMNAKHDEIDSFLQDDLLPTIRTVLRQNGKADSVKKELAELVKTLQAAGMNPDESPKVQDLKKLLGEGAAVSIERDEDEIFSQLTIFFGRYYEGGDFMSLRRYKKETYSPLPMNGEEVKLHWANADQYYIKSAENFQSYVFKVGKGDDKINIRFELVKACAEQNNNKAATGKERRFILNQETPFKMACEDGVDVLVLPFCYVPDAQKRTQKVLNEEASSFLAGLKGDEDVLAQVKDQWATLQAALLSLAPTEKNKKRTAFEKHLNDYTAKNSFDYFIHKDLGGFLRRELDFFIKNEMLYLDNIIPSGEALASDTVLAQHVLSNERALKKLVAFKTIALKIIAFLAQLEEFQKKLWLKKKFVLETNYCFTLDRVPAKFYQKIANTEKQVQDWKDLGFIEEESAVTEEFLQDNPFLVLDTGLFDEDFKAQLLAEIEDIDGQTDGLLVHSENFQALNLMQERYREQVKCVYIDPPYNREKDDFYYKDAYKHSSWATMLLASVKKGNILQKNESALFSSIDDGEHANLRLLLGQVYGEENFLNNIIWQKKYSPSNDTKWLSDNHDFIIAFSKNKERWRPGLLARSEKTSAMYKNPDNDVRGNWKSGDLSVKTYSAENDFTITTPNGRITAPPKGSCWRVSKQKFKEMLIDNRIWFGEDGNNIPSIKRFLSEVKSGVTPLTLWTYTEVGHNQEGKKELIALYDGKVGITTEELSKATPKPIRLLSRIINISNISSNDIILDYFAGSGSTAHATINLNGEDGGQRKYILVEMGHYFDKLLMPRIKKVVYAQKWKGGKPVPTPQKGKEDSPVTNRLGGISHCFKYIRLESYEDVMDNLALTRTQAQGELLDNPKHKQFKADYMLHYMLDIEAKGSLLSPALFQNPFAATMKVVRDNEARSQKIDLVETFNWLLGLTLISTRRAPVTKTAHIVEVIGTNRAGENILILWRTCAPKTPDYTDNDALDAWFKKQDYNTRDMEFDLIYVNGDNNLPNLKKANENWKVQLTEHIFETLMFDVADV